MNINIPERRDKTKVVVKYFQKNYPNYSKETIGNNSMIELDNNPKLTVEEIISIIEPKLKKR